MNEKIQSYTFRDSEVWEDKFTGHVDASLTIAALSGTVLDTLPQKATTKQCEQPDNVLHP